MSVILEVKRIAVLVLAGIAMATGYTLYRHSSQDTRQIEIPDPYAGRDGEEEARRALANGKLILVVYGYPSVGTVAYEAAIREKYGVETRCIGGCIVSQGACAFAEAYNAVMKREIEARYGAGVLEKEMQAARDESERLAIRESGDSSAAGTNPIVGRQEAP